MKYIKAYSCCIILCVISLFSAPSLLLAAKPRSHEPNPMILLDPAGHANYLGRKLKDGYERGATLHFAQELQKTLLTNHNLNVIISRRAGEIVYPLQIASFANRLQVSLIINIHIYRILQKH